MRESTHFVIYCSQVPVDQELSVDEALKFQAECNLKLTELKSKPKMVFKELERSHQDFARDRARVEAELKRTSLLKELKDLLLGVCSSTKV